MANSQNWPFFMTCLSEAFVFSVQGLQEVREGGRGGLDGKYNRVHRNTAVHNPSSKYVYCVILSLIILARVRLFSEPDELPIMDAGTCLGTTTGPTVNAMAIPKYPPNDPIAVAVVRSAGGNHVADTRGGAPRATGPPAITRN